MPAYHSDPRDGHVRGDAAPAGALRSGKGRGGHRRAGAILVLLLGIIAAVAPRGLGRVDEGFNRWTWTALALVVLTLAIAAVGMQPHSRRRHTPLHRKAGRRPSDDGGDRLGIIPTAAITSIIRDGMRWKNRPLIGTDYPPLDIIPSHRYFEVQQWLWESWRFVRQISPLLIVGVFAVGLLRVFIRPEWVETMAGAIPCSPTS